MTRILLEAAFSAFSRVTRGFVCVPKPLPAARAPRTRQQKAWRRRSRAAPGRWSHTHGHRTWTPIALTPPCTNRTTK
eukprot:512256-Prymnesium_polylepis.3